MEDKETLQDRVRRHEGKKLKPYKDHLGNLTIGIGRNLSITGISDDEAEYMFMNDLSNAVTKFKMLSAIEAGDFMRAAEEIDNSLLMKQCRERAEEYYYRMKNGE